MKFFFEFNQMFIKVLKTIVTKRLNLIIINFIFPLIILFFLISLIKSINI